MTSLLCRWIYLSLKYCKEIAESAKNARIEFDEISNFIDGRWINDNAFFISLYSESIQYTNKNGIKTTDCIRNLSCGFPGIQNFGSKITNSSASFKNIFLSSETECIQQDRLCQNCIWLIGELKEMLKSLISTLLHWIRVIWMEHVFLYKECCNVYILELACRHRILQLILKSAFHWKFGATSAPSVPMFERFKNIWDNIDKTKIEPGIKDPLIKAAVEQDIDEMIEFCKEKLKKWAFAEIMRSYCSSL